MNITTSHKTILILAGLIAAGFGTVILLFPVSFYAASGIELAGQVSLLNELRAMGGGLLGCGLLILAGAFVAKLTYTATILAPLLYLAYGISRLLSMGADGMPISALILTAIFEIVIGLMCVYALVKYPVHRV